MRVLTLITFCLLITKAATAQSLSGRFDDDNRRSRGHRIVRNHILTTAVGLGAVDAPGFAGGGEYEHFILKNGMLSATITAMGFSAGTVALGEFGDGETRTHLSGFFAAPGIRFHPVGNDRRADLSLGLAVPLGVSNRRNRYRRDHYYMLEMNDQKPFVAILAQVGVNLKSSGGFVFGAYLSFGPILSEAQRTIERADENSNVYFQFGLRMGGCW